MHIALCCHKEPEERSQALKEEILDRGHQLTIIHDLSEFFAAKIDIAKIDATLLARANLDKSLDHVRAFDVLCTIGVPGLNKPPGSLLVYDKATSHALMIQHELPVPHSRMAKKRDRRHQGIVRKPLHGANGRGIKFFAPGENIPAPKGESVDQELILASRYLRVYATKEKTVGMIKREIFNPLQATVLGDSSQDTLEKVPQKIEELSCKAVSIHCCDYLGLDWLIDDKGEPWLIEANIGFGWSRSHHQVTGEWINLLERL